MSDAGVSADEVAPEKWSELFFQGVWVAVSGSVGIIPLASIVERHGWRWRPLSEAFIETYKASFYQLYDAIVKFALPHANVAITPEFKDVLSLFLICFFAANGESKIRDGKPLVPNLWGSLWRYISDREKFKDKNMFSDALKGSAYWLTVLSFISCLILLPAEIYYLRKEILANWHYLPCELVGFQCGYRDIASVVGAVYHFLPVWLRNWIAGGALLGVLFFFIGSRLSGGFKNSFNFFGTVAIVPAVIALAIATLGLLLLFLVFFFFGVIAVLILVVMFAIPILIANVLYVVTTFLFLLLYSPVLAWRTLIGSIVLFLALLAADYVHWL